MICMEMSGNGVRISGMKTIMGLLQMEVPGKVEVAQTGLTGAAAGSATPGSAGRRSATSTFPSSATAASVSVF